MLMMPLVVVAVAMAMMMNLVAGMKAFNRMMMIPKALILKPKASNPTQSLNPKPLNP